MTRFHLSVPQVDDPRYPATVQHLIDTVMREAIRLRAEFVAQHGISFFETTADIVPDRDNPHRISVSARRDDRIVSKP